MQSLHGQARTVKELLENAMGRTVDPRSPCLAWLIELTGTLLILCHTGAPYDGITAHERLERQQLELSIFPFG